MEKEDKFKHVVYGAAKFHVEEGMYSIAQLEDILAGAKELKAAQDKALDRSMQMDGAA